MIKTAHAFPVHTRRGKLLRVVREHYLRDDLGCGTTCWQQEQGVLHLSENLPRPVDANYVDYLVLDTNVVLKQIDLLELNVLPLSRLIIMQTVLEEVQHKSNSIYNRLVQLVQHSERQTILFPNEHHTETHVDRLPEESANDRNDRAIRAATAWFAKRYGHQADILLLTNDRACREAARQEGLHSISIDAYAKKHSGGFPNLLDFLARGVDEDIGGVASSDGGADAAKTYWYEPHRGVAEIENELKAGKLYRGTLRVNKNYPSEATLSIRTSKTEFYAVVHGMSARNRAIDGDVVAVRILQTHEVADYARKDKRRRSEETMQDGEMVGMWGGETEEVEKDDTPALDDAEKQGGDRDAPATAEITKQGKVKAAVHVSVVGILRRNLRPFCGSILGTSVRSGSEECLFVPVDPRIPCTYIHTRQSKQLIGKRIVVVIDGWGVKSAYPTGHYLKTVGDIGDRETETQVVLIEHDIPTDEFSKAVYACLPPASWVVTPENSVGRLDLRHLPVCSIDPPGCKDIDDALHSRPLPNGNLEVGVHIADVTHFVKPGTAIDKEAANRSTSTYLVDRRLDMLPGLLTTTLCSLVSGVDRFAFSVIWEMTQDGEIVKTKFTKSIIHSRASLTYDQAQEMLDDPVGKTGTIPDAVRALNKIARAQRKKRMDLGALTLASPEVKFSLDDDSRDPTDVKMYVLKEANQLVEEFMLLGNISVAEKIVSTFPRFSLLRRHPEPNAHNFESLIAAANLVGVHIEVETSKQLADSLDLAVKPDDPFFNKLIRIMTTRCMSQAVYFCSGEYSAAEYRHYGLAAKLYTHFTSPIRRYADVIVHRLLAAAIGIEPLPLTYESRSAMRKLCDNMNKRHHMAQLAGRASVALHTLIYFDGRPTVTTASILKVKSDSIVVLVPKFGMEAVIPLTLKKDGVCVDYTFEEDQMLLVHNSEKRKNLRIFDPVTIKIEVVSKGFHRKELKITLEWDSGPAAGRNKRALEIQDGGVATKKKQKSKGRRQ